MFHKGGHIHSYKKYMKEILFSFILEAEHVIKNQFIFKHLLKEIKK